MPLPPFSSTKIATILLYLPSHDDPSLLPPSLVGAQHGIHRHRQDTMGVPASGHFRVSEEVCHDINMRYIRPASYLPAVDCDSYVLHCTVLCCTVLYCTVLYCTVLYCTVLYCTVLYCTVLHCTMPCCAAVALGSFVTNSLQK